MMQSLRQSRVNFLPSGSGDFMRQRLTQAGALLLALCGLAIFVACLTYDPQDPSLNRAVEGAPPQSSGGHPARFSPMC